MIEGDSDNANNLEDNLGGDERGKPTPIRTTFELVDTLYTEAKLESTWPKGRVYQLIKSLLVEWSASNLLTAAFVSLNRPPARPSLFSHLSHTIAIVTCLALLSINALTQPRSYISDILPGDEFLVSFGSFSTSSSFALTLQVPISPTSPIYFPTSPVCNIVACIFAN